MIKAAGGRGSPVMPIKGTGRRLPEQPAVTGPLLTGRLTASRTVIEILQSVLIIAGQVGNSGGDFSLLFADIGI